MVRCWSMGGQIAEVGEYRADGDDGPEVELELATDDPATADHYSAPGDDSAPLPGDFAATMPIEGEAETVASIGYSDDVSRVAGAGEKRIYSRDAGGGVVAEVYLQSDGTVAITQPTGASVTLAADGSITLSGTSVSLEVGEALGSFLQSLHSGILSWVPVPQDGGAALKASLGAWLAKVPPGP